MSKAGDISLSDLEIIERVKNGEPRLFESIVIRYQDKIYGLAVGMLRDDHEAQDVAQETFLNAFRKIETFRGDSAFSSWLYRIAANNAMMRLRTKKRISHHVSLEEDGANFDEDGHHAVPVEDWSKRVDVKLENKELQTFINEAVEKLPAKYQHVFLLSDVEEFSMKEIGDMLNLSISNVKTRLHRARLFLRQELTQYLSLSY